MSACKLYQEQAAQRNIHSAHAQRATYTATIAPAAVQHTHQGVLWPLHRYTVPKTDLVSTALREPGTLVSLPVAASWVTSQR
jgi:hypothetical protein